MGTLDLPSGTIIKLDDLSTRIVFPTRFPHRVPCLTLVPFLFLSFGSSGNRRLESRSFIPGILISFLFPVCVHGKI